MGKILRLKGGKGRGHGHRAHHHHVAHHHHHVAHRSHHHAAHRVHHAHAFGRRPLHSGFGWDKHRSRFGMKHFSNKPGLTLAIPEDPFTNAQGQTDPEVSNMRYQSCGSMLIIMIGMPALAMSGISSNSVLMIATGVLMVLALFNICYQNRRYNAFVEHKGKELELSRPPNVPVNVNNNPLMLLDPTDGTIQMNIAAPPSAPQDVKVDMPLQNMAYDQPGVGQPVQYQAQLQPVQIQLQPVQYQPQPVQVQVQVQPVQPVQPVYPVQVVPNQASVNFAAPSAPEESGFH